MATDRALKLCLMILMTPNVSKSQRLVAVRSTRWFGAVLPAVLC
jgi:hypothetical protein